MDNKEVIEWLESMRGDHVAERAALDAAIAALKAEPVYLIYYDYEGWAISDKRTYDRAVEKMANGINQDRFRILYTHPNR